MKKTVLISFATCLCFITFSQNKKVPISNKIRFGHNLNINYADLQSKKPLPDNANIVNGVCFGLGLLMDYSITSNILISPEMDLSINKSRIEFLNLDNSITNYKLFPASIDFSMHVKYKMSFAKVMPYILCGPVFKLPVDNKSYSSADFKTSPDIAINIGFGLVNKIRNFAFAPEIRYSHGFLNVNENPLLQILNFNNISLLLNFI